MSLCDGVKVGPHTENGKNGKKTNFSDLTEILYVEQFLAATLKALVRFLKFCNFGPHKCKKNVKKWPNFGQKRNFFDLDEILHVQQFLEPAFENDDYF